ncbi:MAG: hypothetical protein ACODAU_11305 [Myxococcota bacterium]
MIRRILASVLLATLGAAGCGGGDDRLTARGAMTLEVDEATTGFDLPEPTRLEDDRDRREDRRLAGHCTFGGGEGAEPLRLSVGLERTGVADDLGLRSFEVTIEEPDRSEAVGYVHADVGGTPYMAEGSRTGTCRVAALYFDREAGLAGVSVDCVLSGPEGAEAQAEAELELSGCG